MTLVDVEHSLQSIGKILQSPCRRFVNSISWSLCHLCSCLDSYGFLYAHVATGCNWRHFIMIERLLLKAISPRQKDAWITQQLKRLKRNSLLKSPRILLWSRLLTLVNGAKPRKSYAIVSWKNIFLGNVQYLRSVSRLKYHYLMLFLILLQWKSHSCKKFFSLVTYIWTAEFFRVTLFEKRVGGSASLTATVV